MGKPPGSGAPPRTRYGPSGDLPGTAAHPPAAHRPGL